MNKEKVASSVILILLLIVVVWTANYIKNQGPEGYTVVTIDGRKYKEGDVLPLFSKENVITLKKITSDGGFIIEYSDLYTSASAYGDLGQCDQTSGTKYSLILTEESVGSGGDNLEICLKTNTCAGSESRCFIEFEKNDNSIKVKTK